MKFPYFPFYVKDFSADAKVEDMALNEVGAYMLLLCKAWHEEPPGTLPNNDRTLANWSRLFEHWGEHKQYVMAPFTLEADGRWHQKRMEQVYQELCSRNAQASAKARAAALKRWKNAPSIPKQCSKHEELMPQAMLEQCNSNSNSNNKEEGNFSESNGKTYHQDARAVIHILNETAGKQFRETHPNLAAISERLREPGVTVDGIREMIVRQNASWANSHMAEYLRPATLFGKKNFDNYYGNRLSPVIHENNRGNSIDRNAGTTNSKQPGAYEGIGKRKA